MAEPTNVGTTSEAARTVERQAGLYGEVKDRGPLDVHEGPRRRRVRAADAVPPVTAVTASTTIDVPVPDLAGGADAALEAAARALRPVLHALGRFRSVGAASERPSATLHLAVDDHPSPSWVTVAAPGRLRVIGTAELVAALRTRPRHAQPVVDGADPRIVVTLGPSSPPSTDTPDTPGTPGTTGTRTLTFAFAAGTPGGREVHALLDHVAACASELRKHR
ncbi:hypothetical protein FTX61_16935 [Nitriliruptoraceae bacterium ZYF776]|nr:hypothetical protein [Profundirhabdus halotolerans]